MSLVAWFVLGLITGMLVSRMIDHRDPRRVDALLGAAGAVAGGWLFTSFGIARLTSRNRCERLHSAVQRPPLRHTPQARATEKFPNVSNRSNNK